MEKMICVAAIFSYFWYCAAIILLRGAALGCVLLHCCVVKEMFSLSREEVGWRCSVNKVSLQISQSSQENTCVGLSFVSKLLAWDQQIY